jgi:uncharacterized protein with HEPN domain
VSSNNLPSEKIKGYFERIVRDCLKVLRRIEGIEKKRFVESEEEFMDEKRDAIAKRLENIGENVWKLITRSSILDKYPYEDWKSIAGFRHICVHDYDIIDFEDVYDIVINEIPHLLKSISKIYEQEYKSDVIEAISKKYKPILRKNNTDENNSSNSV